MGLVSIAPETQKLNEANVASNPSWPVITQHLKIANLTWNVLGTGKFLVLEEHAP
ncbi:hypothetical protein [Mesorhizobium sp. INR15]|uniref:hypothetical protein n=1 Tax=Mesorhizobium sp. INR15 TaxID=2654248 RepID=UPI001896832E|nr:hypothetical protein [Mesorhizobium sp. INR15]